jgi:HK97 family phage major capsid protein
MTATDVAFPALDELDRKIEAKQKDLAGIFAEAGPEIDLTKVTSLSGDTMAKAAEIRQRNDELTDLGKQRDELRAVKQAAEGVRVAPGPGGKVDAGGEAGAEPGAPTVKAPETKSFGQMFVESKAYKGRTGSIGPETRLDIEAKTLFETTNGWAPETTRTGRVVPFATRPIQVTDIIPQTTTTQAAVVYMEETTYDASLVVEKAEGAAFGEATLELTEQSSTVRKIPVFLPVTDEQLEDEPQVRGYIDNRLPFMLRQRLDLQILVGTGVAPLLRGVNNVVGIQTQAKGTDPTPDAVYKAITKVRTIGFAEPNAVVMHPNDWQDIRLLRTADGLYIWGNPSEAGPERIWGLTVAQAVAQTENTGVVGDFANFSELAIRRGVDVQVSNSHGTFFVEGKQAIRADMRVALVWYRPAAFCTVTGI